jgi:Family of unknown function (DUF695)
MNRFTHAWVLRWLSLATLVVFALSLSACSPAGRSPNPTGVRQGNWALAEGEHGGKKLLFAFREDLAEEQRKAKPRLLTVSWRVDKTDDVGQPLREELAKLDDSERRLVPALEKDGKAVLVAVITIDHQHDWYFYVEDVRAARAIVTQTIGPENMAWVTVLSETDPNGAFYASVKKHAN